MLQQVKMGPVKLEPCEGCGNDCHSILFEVATNELELSEDGKTAMLSLRPPKTVTLECCTCRHQVEKDLLVL